MIIKIFALLLLTFSLQAETATSSLPKTVHELPANISSEIPALDQTPTEIPSSAKENDSYEHAFIKMILTLGGLLVLVFLSLWLLRKFSHGRIGGFGSTKKIKVLEKKPLSPKTILYLVELDGKPVFLAESQLEIKTLLSPYSEIEE